MFGFIAKIPKLALLGFVVLLIGFSPDILATVRIDTRPPDIYFIYPGGSEATPTPLSLGTITVVLDIITTDAAGAQCTVTPQGHPSVGFPLTPTNPQHWEASYDVVYSVKHKFEFKAWDFNNNYSTATGWGEVGDADGDFYMKDGNDPDYIKVTKDATVTFNHKTLYFKFKATEHGGDITRVWIEVVGQKTFDLTETVANTEWDGTSWTAPSDGTYTIYGYFSAFGRDFRNLSILVGSGVEPTPPSEWSTYDWLKIIGGALIVVGFIVKK